MLSFCLCIFKKYYADKNSDDQVFGKYFNLSLKLKIKNYRLS